MRKLGMALVMGLLATPLVASAASAAPCVNGGSVASYEGITCSVGGVTFSAISVTDTTTGTGVVSLGTFVVEDNTSTGEFGLQLDYTASTGTAGTADVAWSYNVSGNLLSDTVLTLNATTFPPSTSGVTETLSNGVVLTFLQSGVVTQTFAPIGELGVTKDQANISGTCSQMEVSAGTCGGTTASILENDWSLTSATPIPGALPLFATGLVGFWGLRKKRSKQSAAAQAA